MRAKLFNQNGEAIGEIELPREVFGQRFNPDLVHQVVTAQMANQRQGTAHTKDRKEVSGGGRKPWPQKHMGRARHGSIRSPIWRHGGVSHGPRSERIWKKKIPQKMRRKALFSILSQKFLDNELVFVDDIRLNRVSTKELLDILDKLKLVSKKTLIILPRMDRNIILSARNIKNVSTAQATDINCLQLLSFKHLLFLRGSLDKIKERFLK